MKGNQTCIEWLCFQWAMYVLVNRSHSEGTFPQHGNIILDKPASRVAAYVSGFCSRSAPNDSWSSEALLEELATILFVQHAIDFALDININ
jgi:hypothetical protein